MHKSNSAQEVIHFLEKRLASYEYPQEQLIEYFKHTSFELFLSRVGSIEKVLKEQLQNDRVRILSAYSLLWTFFSSLYLLKHRKSEEYSELVLFSDVISVIVYDILLELDFRAKHKDVFIQAMSTMHIEGLSFLKKNTGQSFEYFDAHFLFPHFMNLVSQNTIHEHSYS